MEKVKHIKNVTIENFKCFNYLSIDNFSKYNIILGDNNVGKTSLIEIMLFDENITQTIYNLQSLIYFRRVFGDDGTDNVNPLLFFLNKFSESNSIKVNLNYNHTSISTEYQTVNVENLNEEERLLFSKKYNVSRTGKEILKVKSNGSVEFRSFNVDQNFEQYDDFLPYVYSCANYNTDLIRFYSDNFIEDRNLKKRLIDQLKFLTPELIDVELTLNYDKDPGIGFWIEKNGKESLIPLAMFGDGTIRLFRLIMEIIMCTNKFICIDEIDTGIHYSKFKDFIKTILIVASQNNVQLFITTHNNEFLKSYKDILEEDSFETYQDETKWFSLKRLPHGDIKAYSYSFNQFEFAIEQENELR